MVKSQPPIDLMTITAQATVEGYVDLLKRQHAYIEDHSTIEEVLEHADAVSATDWPDYIKSDLIHHLERRRAELLRKSGALAG